MSFEHDPLRAAAGLVASESADVAIRVTDISKCHHIYATPSDRLKQFIFPRLQPVGRRASKPYFTEFWALKSISFEVNKGETVGIVGTNGSGKSTLLQIICGTLTPSSGIVETNGRVAALLELGAGFNPEFTGTENVYLNAALMGLTKEQVDARFDEIAAFADIGEFIRQPVKTYSSGMVVRLAFAVQSIIDPDIFIIDEALAVGDEKFQRKCFARLEKLKANGCSILFVSHSPGSVTEFCDRALLLEQGERLMYGDARSTIRAYQKLIYAPVDEQRRLIASYKEADRAGQSPEVPALRLDASGVRKCLESFDPGLVPETTMAYASQGALIESMHISNMDGVQVNVLAPSSEYQFIVSGRFTEDRNAVYFGIHIKTVSGIEVTGQRHPVEGEYIGEVKAGQLFRIAYRFKTTMLPGVYFVGGGVWSYEEPACLHRLLDALMFRVVAEGGVRCFGYMDASAAEPLLEIF